MRWRAALVVDPVACDGHGVCADIFPEQVNLDPWGYPILSGGGVPAALLPHARRAVASCPKMALHLVENPA